MKYQEFVDQVVKSVKCEVAKEATVMVKPVRRNNDFSSDGLNIVRDDNILSPTVFLDECYEDYLKGRSIGTIVSDITEFYNSHDENNSLDISYFYNFPDASAHIAFKIINYERNVDILNEIPYEIFLDFAVVCYCLVEHPLFGTGSILIRNTHLDYWGINKETLFAKARENTPIIQPYILESAKEELSKAGMDSDDYPLMYMLTNKNNYYGAACMLYEGVLERISDEIESDLYILPSSVDELFIIKRNLLFQANELKALVIDINKHFVSKESFLSNNVYVYERDAKQLRIL